MFLGMVEVTHATAEALDSMVVFGDVTRLIEPEKAAWVTSVLRELPDTDTLFPRGKWATIQHIEQQVTEQAKAVALDVSTGPDRIVAGNEVDQDSCESCGGTGLSQQSARLRAAADYITNAERELAEMRAVCGPKCPTCGHFSKADHRWSYNPSFGELRRYCRVRSQDDVLCTCEMRKSALIRDHPQIAAALGLAPEADRG